jgi:radical SAM superfamily enzyme YgiQ (UPF0313 family)
MIKEKKDFKVVLVDPGFGRGGFKTFGKSHWSSIIHHGLCSISACAKKAGYPVELIDFRKLGGLDDFREELKRRSPSLIGFTVKSCDVDVVYEAIRIVKEENNNIIVVVGGNHPTFDPETTAQNRDIDYVLTGEAEISFIEMLEAVRNGQDFPRIIAGKHPNLDELPYDDREL